MGLIYLVGDAVDSVAAGANAANPSPIALLKRRILRYVSVSGQLHEELTAECWPPYATIKRQKITAETESGQRLRAAENWLDVAGSR